MTVCTVTWIASDIEPVLRLGIEAASANDCSCGGEPWVRRI
jgi:hypothetical protein